MSDLEKAARLALGNICSAKLCEINSMSSRQEMIRLMDEAITALRQALEQPAQQCNDCNGMGIQDGKGDKCLSCDGHGEQPAQQEPIGYTTGINWQPRQSEMVVKIVRNKQPEHGFVHAIYTSPQRKPWVGLTGDEISECWGTGNVVAAVEAKLKDKNA